MPECRQVFSSLHSPLGLRSRRASSIDDLVGRERGRDIEDVGEHPLGVADDLRRLGRLGHAVDPCGEGIAPRPGTWPRAWAWPLGRPYRPGGIPGGTGGSPGRAGGRSRRFLSLRFRPRAPSGTAPGPGPGRPAPAGAIRLAGRAGRSPGRGRCRGSGRSPVDRAGPADGRGAGPRAAGRRDDSEARRGRCRGCRWAGGGPAGRSPRLPGTAPVTGGRAGGLGRFGFGGSGTSRSGFIGTEGSRPRDVDGEDRRPEMLAGVAERLEVGATATGDELLAPEPEPDPVLLGPPDPRHDLAGRAAVMTTRFLAKYDWPRERTPSGNSRAIFWARPDAPSPPGRPPCRRRARGRRPPASRRRTGSPLPGPMPVAMPAPGRAGGPGGRRRRRGTVLDELVRVVTAGLFSLEVEVVAPTTHPLNLR